MQRPFLSTKARKQVLLGMLAAGASWIAAAVRYAENGRIDWFLLANGALWLAFAWQQGRRIDEK
jgi:hypothetical protein